MAFITRQAAQFMYNGKRFRGVGFDAYWLIVETATQATVQTLFNAAQARGVTVMRLWCFDAGNPPTNSPGNFQYVTSLGMGINLLPNPSFETNTAGWYLDGDFTRSNLDSHTGSWAIKQTSSGGFQNFTTINDGTGIVVAPNTNYTLTFWYKLAVTGFGPIMTINTGSAFGTQIANAFPGDTGGVWTQGSITFNSGANTNIWIRIFNNNGTVAGYWDDFILGTAAGNVIAWREANFQQLDMVVDEARKRGIKLMLSLADNPTYGTKQAYCHLSDAIYGTSLEAAGWPYTGFFDNANCRTLYKNFFSKLANRVNTINGMTYKNDDAIFSWELGNELRYDVFSSEGGTQNTASSTDIAAVKDWITDVSGYMKSVDPNHLIGYGDMGHTWQWVNGDVVSNGSGYGVDYNIFSAIPTIDYLDFHIYPTQGDGVHLQEYGQRLGFPNAVSGEGFRAQLRDYVSVAKANGKPVLCGELGFVRESVADNTYYPLYPRYQAFRNIFKDFFAADGDVMLLWSATTAGGGSYSVGLGDTGGTEASLNSNDTVTMDMINNLNASLVNTRKKII